MNQYIIQQKIKTISDLCILENGVPVPMIIDNIEFRHWDFNISDGCQGDAWIIEAKEDAENYHNAVINFRKRLSKIVPKVAFISQCYMDYTQESFLVLKTNDNPDKTAFIYYPTNRGAPGLMFMEDEKDSFGNLNLENQEFFWYMNDCYNTIGYTAKLLLIFAALESLAQKDDIKEILGSELFEEVYGRGGLRHRLSHGAYIDESFSGKNYVEVLHNLILEYFNKNFGTKIKTGIVHPQRHPFGNAYLIKTFIRPKEENSIGMTLKSVLADFEAGDAINTQTLPNFDLISRSGLEAY